MNKSAVVLPLTKDAATAFEMNAALNALTSAVLVVAPNNRVVYANGAAEQLFSTSIKALTNLEVASLLPKNSPVFTLMDQVRGTMSAITEHGLTLDTPKTGKRLVNVQAAFIVDAVWGEPAGSLVLTFDERSVANQIDHRLTHRDAARSMAAMSSMLAHEIKNPLSGIRGAAQLLEQNASAADQELTRLIQDEVDRIKDLVDRMEVFSDGAPIKTEPVNIHQVLGRVHKIAAHGFAQDVKFTENYDPSLPPVLGNRDLLIQVFLNLVKNAAEAVPKGRGEITLKTSYQHGVRFAVPGSQSRVHLPLAITVQDNGAGIPEDIRQHLFDPFVTTKANGSGLGLGLVAKIIGDLGGVIDFKSKAGRTEFRILLPVSKDPLPTEGNEELEMSDISPIGTLK